MEVTSYVFWLHVALKCIIIEACLFHRFLDMKTDSLSVLEYHIVRGSGPVCEALCLKNPHKCSAANVVPLLNGAFLCEFVTTWTDGMESSMAKMEPNPGGRYIARSTGPVTPGSLPTSKDVFEGTSTVSYSNMTPPPSITQLKTDTTYRYTTTSVTSTFSTGSGNGNTAVDVTHKTGPGTGSESTTDISTTEGSYKMQTSTENPASMPTDSASSDTTTTGDLHSGAHSQPTDTGGNGATTASESTLSSSVGPVSSTTTATTQTTDTTNSQSTTTQTPLICPSGMTKFESVNKCYVLSPTAAKRFSDALSYCSANYHMDAFLVEVHSYLEQQIMVNISGGKNIWLGGKRVSGGGLYDFNWVRNDQPLGYTYGWVSGEPTGSGEDCLRVAGPGKYWIDNRCTNKAAFVCQYE